MHWYEVRQFGERIEEIETFLIEIAANEEQLLTFGFHRALTLPGAAAGLQAMKTFNADFASLRRYAQRFDGFLGRCCINQSRHGDVYAQRSGVKPLLTI
ncbi:hypothetical protein, partial [Burkholderia ubonensis]|uniref:hypothetical protein n=1 Tax=Burkholderia ubonensis TaxID=101571 RepID=UPI001E32AC51